jgi:hypothetical protein
LVSLSARLAASEADQGKRRTWSSRIAVALGKLGQEHGGGGGEEREDIK